MTRPLWSGSWCLAPFAVALVGCLSSSPPLPPVRWFDPLPAAPVDAAARPAATLRVTAGGHLGREFVVRTAPRELVFDERHGWIAEPAALVRGALERRLDVALGPIPAADAVAVAVDVEAFELDLQQTPRAVVRLGVHVGAERSVVATTAEAASSAPGALAEAMAAALAEAAASVAARVARR